MTPEELDILAREYSATIHDDYPAEMGFKAGYLAAKSHYEATTYAELVWKQQEKIAALEKRVERLRDALEQAILQMEMEKV